MIAWWVLGVVSRAASPILHDPSLETTAPAPARYDVRFETNEGVFVVAVHREWAPRGADRLYHLVDAGWYDGSVFFRVVRGFVAQWGLSPDPVANAAWREAKLKDDPVVVSNAEGRVTFATGGPDGRTTQLFVNLGDHAELDRAGFAPVGEVVSGWDVVQKLHSGYGDAPPKGRGPKQARLAAEGQVYAAEFPKLDRIVGATLVAVP